MKTIIFGTSLVMVFFLGLQYKTPKTDPATKDRTDWKQWKSLHPNIKPWQIKK